MTSEEILKTDLLSLGSKNFYFKHIVKSHNWYFSDYLNIPQNEIIDRMDLFKEIVSTKLGVNFHSIQIVGSAKTGYSLSPYKLFIPFHDESEEQKPSDIDIAIISDKLFQQFWDDLRKIKDVHYKKHYYNHLTQSIFRGYIDEKDIIEIPELCKKWEQLIIPINITLQDELGFIHPITYRLYRNWDDLEEYQIISITKARRLLEGN